MVLGKLKKVSTQKLEFTKKCTLSVKLIESSAFDYFLNKSDKERRGFSQDKKTLRNPGPFLLDRPFVARSLGLFRETATYKERGEVCLPLRVCDVPFSLPEHL